MVYRLLFLSFLLLSSIRTLGCSCSFPPEITTRESVKNYDFVALAEIKELSPIDTLSGRWLHRKNGDFKISIIQLFKGDTLSVLNEPSVNSSCDFGMRKGQQWLFFGNKGKQMMEINPCTHTTLYREVNGERDWYGFRGMGRLTVLQRIFGHVNNDLKEKIYYANGKVEIQQTFKKGKLNGTRNIYYPNGQLFSNEKFKNGKRIGHRKIYASSGQLIFEEKYWSDYVKWNKRYYDTASISEDIPLMAKLESDLNPSGKKLKEVMDSLYKDAQAGWLLNHVIQYADDGLSYTSVSYDQRGHIKAKAYVNFKKQKSESYNYYKNGKVQTYNMRDMAKNVEIEHDYKEDGSRSDFLNKCESCKFYFDKKYITGGLAEPIYIQ